MEKIMTKKNIWDLDLHEASLVMPGIHAVRVPGGWLYIYDASNTKDGAIVSSTSTFVPYSEEFK